MSVKYYIENKKRLLKEARKRYQNLSKEEWKKSDNMTVNKNFSEDEGNKLVEYRKKNITAWGKKKALL